MIFTSGDAKVKKVCPGGKEQQLYLERKQQSGTYISRPAGNRHIHVTRL